MDEDTARIPCTAGDPALEGPYDKPNVGEGDPVNAHGRTEAMNTPEALAAERGADQP